MTVSVVNGYLCFSSCDAAKAKAGQDPHPDQHAGRHRGTEGAANIARGPAVLFGGSLGNGSLNDGSPAGGGSGNAVNPVDATAASDPTSSNRKLDILA